MTRTITVYVANIANKPFNRAPASASKPRVGQGSGARVKPDFAAPRDYTGTTNYFFYVEVYVDSSKPTGATTLGNCATQGGGTDWGWVYSLGPGQTTTVPIDCWLTPGEHTFYAQVDSCDDPSGNVCSSSYGYVRELNENNTYPASTPIKSGDPFLFLPIVRIW